MVVGALDHSLAGAEGALEVVVGGRVEAVLVGVGDSSPELLLGERLLVAASSSLLLDCSLAERP